MSPDRIWLEQKNYFHQGSEKNTQHDLSIPRAAMKEIKQLTATPFLFSNSFTHAHTEKQ